MPESIHTSLLRFPRPSRVRFLLLLPFLTAMLGSGCTRPSEEDLAPPPPDRLEIVPPASAFRVGDSVPLAVAAWNARQLPITDPPVTWSSDHPEIVSVDPDGTATARSAGTATLTAAVRGKTASIRLEVKSPPVARITIDPGKAVLRTGQTLSLMAAAYDERDRPIAEPAYTWTSASPSVATVDPSGLVTAVSPGAADITAGAEDKSQTVEITVVRPQPALLEIHPNAASGAVGSALRLRAFWAGGQAESRPARNVFWKSENPSIAVVSQKGLVRFIAEGTAKISAKAGGRTASAVLTAFQAARGGATSKKAPSAPSQKTSKGDLKAEFKGRDPSELVYLSGITGEIAGTGDPAGFSGEAERAGMSQHPLALELSDLPKDRYGLIDWATAIKAGKVKPRPNLDPRGGPDEPPLQLDVVIFTKSQSMPDVVFPHFVHTLWLSCANCHPAIFPMNAKAANKMMTMAKIAAGEFCGRCHNRVAFPLSDCLRCHVKDKHLPPLDPDFAPAGGQGKK